MSRIAFSRNFTWTICLSVLALTACTHSTQDKTHDNTKKNTPALVSLCNSIDYTDTASLHNEKIMANRMASIVRLLPHTDSIPAKKALATFLNGVKGDSIAIGTATDLADRYLGNPASPARNETLYIMFLRSVLSADSIPETVRFRSSERLRTAMQNRPGTIATDFRFIDRNGKQSSLHDHAARQMLLVFYDPECPHCSDILKAIAEDTKINTAIANGVLTVLAIYTEGKKELWERTCHNMPANWNVGYDLSNILENELYDLPAMPILYLLDSDKRVLLKDPDVSLLCRQTR